MSHSWPGEGYHVVYLTALDLSDPTAALDCATDILRRPDAFAPVVVWKACEIIFKSALAVSILESQSVFQTLEPILKTTLRRFEQDSASFNRPIYVAALSLLGAGYENRGESEAAVYCYSEALKLEPDNDALLVSRGVLQYGTGPRSVADLEKAIQLDSKMIWPYVLLAHHYVLSRRLEECRNLCERALRLKGSEAVKSEISEWLAIAQAGLGFPVETVRTSFDVAIRLDPSNERARRNLSAFESANKPLTAKIWETRSTSAVRTWGLIEKRFAMAV